MQKFLFAVVISMSSVLFSCDSEKKTDEVEPKDKTASENIEYPYKAEYSSSFEIGNPKHSEAILKLWKSFDNGDLSVTKDLFADTIHIYTKEGMTIEGPRDSVVMGAQQWRDQLASVQSKVTAFVPLRSTDKNENWVLVWGTEISTDKAGKVDSVYLQETWRIDKDGKVDLMYQYGAKPEPPTEKK
jgi:hypothetical protein